jgi:hypothetical protein
VGVRARRDVRLAGDLDLAEERVWGPFVAAIIWAQRAYRLTSVAPVR